MNLKSFSSQELIVLILTSLFFLHDSSYIAFYTPAIVWAGVVLCLFFTLWSLCSKTINCFIYLFPVVVIDAIWKIVKIPSLFDVVAVLQLSSNIMQFAILPMLTYFLLKKNNVILVWCILIVYSAVQVTTGISTIIACDIDPTLARMDYGTLRVEDPVLYAYRMNLNVGDYHTSYGFTAMLPIVIMFFKWADNISQRFILRLLLFMICIIMVYTVYSASYTMSLLVCLLMLLVFLCPRKMSRSFFLKSLFVAFIASFIFRIVIPNLLNSAADFMNNEIMSERLSDLAAAISGNDNNSDDESDFNLRLLAYEKSWNCFLSNPIIGSLEYKKSGGHSYFLDNIGLMGIFGAYLIINMFGIIWKRYFLIFRSYPWFYYYGYALLSIVIFFCVNPDGMSEQLLFFYPISAYLLSHHYNNYKFK